MVTRGDADVEPPRDSGVDTSGPTTGTEAAVTGRGSAAEVLALLSGYTDRSLGSPVAAVAFRAGRIDVVWGLRLADGRDVVVKVRRPPVDLPAVTASARAQALLHASGYPCARVLSGPDRVGGHVLLAEERLTAGAAPDGRAPGVRALLARGLARHVDLLRAHPELLADAGHGPSWCRYQHGPWPVPHDTIVEFSRTPAGCRWLDDLARRASEQVLAHRRGRPLVVGHADWYAGNAAVAGGRLVATYDWDLVADTEAVVAGIAAAGCAASATGAGGMSTPEEVAAFLRDYGAARGAPLAPDEQRTAAGAAAWVVAFNARWEVAMAGPGCEGATTRLARERGEDLLRLAW